MHNDITVTNITISSYLCKKKKNSCSNNSCTLIVIVVIVFGGKGEYYFVVASAFKRFILKLDMITSIFINIFVQDCRLIIIIIII